LSFTPLTTNAKAEPLERTPELKFFMVATMTSRTAVVRFEGLAFKTAVTKGSKSKDLAST